MPDKGTLTFQIYTARMAQPLPDASVTVPAAGTAAPIVIAHRTTDASGRTAPIDFFTPEMSATTAPGDAQGYIRSDVHISHPGYYDVIVRNVQVFPETESLQQMEMIPLPEHTKDAAPREYLVTPQSL